MMLLGLFTKPSSSAIMPKPKYKQRVLGGISRKASDMTIVFANIRLSAMSITSHL
jgi:hypothetical protein